ncbi:alcohol dehydrogenase-like protein [Nocardia nova SH22a]|uniref:Alcohol dehydrogenase-like protein n=1 Tax=Nocardia nova SH22a TaxID=1415166 RepID=W5TEZ5_9NOCA|nr:alcohol dehydrogenase catalytic domain-containing protein [Nocardia nova]AHH17578.1 alcohol dehydrogenase-like protein [Nocardia nova SH22a]
MKAVRYYGKGDVRFEDGVPEPELRPGTVMVAPAWTGLCGSDLHLYFEGPIPPAPPSTTEAHPLTGETLPIIMGHEFSGVVERIGEGVTGFVVGESVVVEPLVTCGHCPACRSGRYNDCETMACLGISGGGGGLSEHVVVAADRVHPVGDVPLDEAALIEPLCVAYHGVRQSGAKAGDIAVVGGAGPVGVLAAAALKGVGATTIVSEISAIRRQTAIATGVADYVVNPLEESLQDKVAEITGGNGADVAFDCAGVEVVLDQLMDVLKVGGILEMIGIYPSKPQIDMVKLVFKEISIQGSVGYAGDHAAVIELVRDGKINLKPFITARIQADDFVEGGLKYLEKDKDSQVKMIVRL